MPLILALAFLVVGGCAASFQPHALEEVNFLERAQTKSQGNIQVTAAVLSADETEQVFGFPLYKKGIQPVWLEIQNKVSGFVFTNLDEGTKTFNVDVIGEDKQLRTFTFFIPVPGIRADHHAVDWENLYPEEDVADHEESDLRKALETLPCCTANQKGTELGDPLNLVVIGNLDDVYYAFIRAGWDETETIYRASLFKTIRSFLFGGRYRYSPVSALYVFGRGQDVAFQRARTSIHERNHLRLWLAPMRFDGKLVWIGQISRDIGVRFTSKTITTGLRAILWVSSQPSAFGDVGWFDWEYPTAR